MHQPTDSTLPQLPLHSTTWFLLRYRYFSNWWTYFGILAIFSLCERRNCTDR